MFDALTARAIAAELNGTLAHGRVQAVLPIDPLTIGFEIYAQHARRYLLASADPTQARLHLVSEKLRASTAPPTPLILLLRKYTRNAFVNRVEVVPRERVLRIIFDHAEQGVSTFVAEIMERRSNLILLDAAGMILDAVKHITPDQNRARTILPREKYVLPPMQD